MDRELFALKANERYQKAREFWRNWRVQAVDDYAFVSGDQWISEDAAKLESEDRPAVTFNYSEKMIDAVMGAEVSNRQEVYYAPRGVEDSQLSELWNAAAKWARDQCDAEDEESDAFRDALVCGIGWTWTRLSYDEDLDGRILIERVDPLEMFPDPASIRPGLMDRRWHDRLWWVDETEVRRQWPDAIFSVEDNDANTGVIVAGHRYTEDSTMDDVDRHKGQVQLRLHETYEMEDVYRVAAPTTDGQQNLQEISAEDFAKVRSQVPKDQYIKQRKRVYYRAYFAGDTLLEVKKSPCQDGYCFQAITAKRDRNRNTWYGLTRVMKDPQRWANKWLSQILHIVNANAKGGILAEIGAFVDPVAAQEEWAQADSVTLLNEGGINKVMQKQQAPYPSGLDKLMSFALNSLPMVTGINLEALGLANRDQSGVVEQQRKQAAYGLLSPIFDGQRRYRKAQGRVLLYYIHTYISDGRMIRIGGPESQQFLPLTKMAGAPSYDIIVGQSPTAPDSKQKTWETLVEIIPAMLKAEIPLPPDLLDFTPLPVSLVTKWKQFVAQSQQQQQQTNQQVAQVQQQAQEQIQDLQQQLNAALQKQHDRSAELAFHQQKAQQELDLNAYTKAQELALKERAQLHDMGLKSQAAENDYRIKVASAIGAGADTEIPQLLSTFAQASHQLAQHTSQNNEGLTAVLHGLLDALSRPKRIIFDAKGQPIGVEPGPPTQH